MKNPTSDPVTKSAAGLWIDHRKAVIVILSANGEKTTVVQSQVEKQPGRYEGVRSTTPFESHNVSADDRHQRKFTSELRDYYKEVIDVIGESQSILLLGPGEAKGELKKRLEHDHPGKQVIEIETSDKMTDRQIAAKVHDHFHL
ncbi:MAG: hypothetical protein V4507_13185 [Verrucomicrobiota bacterium]